jgi:hypothetical protein
MSVIGSVPSRINAATTTGMVEFGKSLPLMTRGREWRRGTSVSDDGVRARSIRSSRPESASTAVPQPLPPISV